VRRGTPFEAELRASGSFEAWKALLFGAVSSDRLRRTGKLELDDPDGRWPDFLDAFALEP
jgi:hypothetical protein